MYHASENLLKTYTSSLSLTSKTCQECKATAVLFRRLQKDEPSLCKLLDSVSYFAIQQRHPMKDDTFIPLTLQVAAVLGFAEIRKWSSEEMRMQLKAYGKEILSAPIYRTLFAILSPTLVTRGAAMRFEHDFKGVKAVGKSVSSNSATMTLSNPDHMFPAFYVASYNGIFEAALEAASAKKVVSGVQEYLPTSSVSLFKWE